jgi:integrase
MSIYKKQGKNKTSPKLAPAMKNLKDIKPKQDRYEIKIDRGLYARVSVSGTMSIVFKYQFNGRPRKLRIGRFPDMTQAQIQKRYFKVRGDVATGIDPWLLAEQAKEQDRKEELARASVVTVARAADAFLADVEFTVAKKTFQGYRSVLKCHIEPSKIWHLPIEEVTYFDLTEIIASIHAAKTPSAAGNTKRALSRLFNWCVMTGFLKYSVASHLHPQTSDDPVHNEKPTRTRTLSDREIRAVWHELEGPYGDAAKMVLLSGCRRPEIVGMHLDEIKDGWWTVPLARIKTRKKSKRDFRVFMTPSLKEVVSKKKGLIFESRTFKGQSFDEKRMSEEFKRAVDTLGIEDLRLYDCRRTLRTRVEKEFARTMPYVGALLLNHAQDAISKVYNQYQYDAEKQEALLWWDGELRRIIYGDNVVNFPDTSLGDSRHAKKFSV